MLNIVHISMKCFQIEDDDDDDAEEDDGDEDALEPNDELQ